MNGEIRNNFSSGTDRRTSQDTQVKKASSPEGGASVLLTAALAVAVTVAVLFYTMTKHEHVWLEANCTSPRICQECQETEGEPLGHNWQNATAWLPSRCVSCGITSGRSLGYNLTLCKATKDSNEAGSTTDVKVGRWTDTFGCGYEDAIRFWVADFGNWSPEEYVQYQLDGQFSELDLTIAAEENSGVNTRGKLLVYCGTELLYESDWVTDATPAVRATVDVRGCDEILLVYITDSPDFHYGVVEAVLYN